MLKPLDHRQLHLNILTALCTRERESRQREARSRLERRVSRLEDETRLLELVVNSVRDGVIACDENGEYIVFNASAERMIGKRMEVDLTQRPEGYGLYRSDAATLFPAGELPLTRAIKGVVSDEVEIYVKNGHVPGGISISVSGRPFPMAVDKPRGGVIIFRDITREKEERAKLEETVSELQVQARLLETIFESMDEGLVVADAEGCLVLANSRMEEILGMGMVTSPPDDWSATYGAYHSDRKTLIPTEELPLVRALRGLSTDEMEVYVRNQQRPEGVYVSATGRPILSDDGKVRAGVVAFRDVTSRRDAQAKLSNTVATLRSQTRLMRTVFDSMSDGLVVADADGNFTIFNPSAEKIVGIGMLEVPPDQWTESYGIFRTDQETHVPMQELPLVRAMGGEAIDVRWSCSYAMREGRRVSSSASADGR